MEKKLHCEQCLSVCDEQQDISRHHSLITIEARDVSEKDSLFIFFCKECYTLLSMKLNLESPMEDQIEIYNGKLTDEFIKNFSLALVAENKRELIEKRKEFLGKRLMPIYEPIDDQEWGRLIKGQKEQKESVVQAPYFPQWYENPEDALDSLGHEDEWDESFSFSYADPQDLHIVSPKTKMPRFFRTFLVSADEIEPILRIERNEPARLEIWKQTLSKIEKISIWDDKEGKNLSNEEFMEKFTEDDLYLNSIEPEYDLSPYVQWIEENVLNSVAI